jgi:isopentenyldiphosphate isomerase
MSTFRQQDRGTIPEGCGERFEIVDGGDRVIGTALRRECHGNPALAHRTAHVVVRASDGRVLLQKRSATKDIQPGRWDTAVGGHLRPGETYEQAARREMTEEIGVDARLPLTHLFDSRIRNAIETEHVRVFGLCHDGPFAPQADEIDELRFWSAAELEQALGCGLFTPNLEAELAELRARRLL